MSNQPNPVADGKTIKPSDLQHYSEIEGKINLLRVDIKHPQRYKWYFSLSEGKYLPHRKPTMAEKRVNKFISNPRRNKKPTGAIPALAPAPISGKPMARADYK